MRQKLLSFAAVGEGGFGVLLCAAPKLVARLLIGTEISGAAVMVGRLAGLGLVVLGVVCWPRGDARSARNIMLSYSVLAMVLLIVAGLRGLAGFLLWPGVVVHGVISLLLWKSGKGLRLN